MRWPLRTSAIAAATLLVTVVLVQSAFASCVGSTASMRTQLEQVASATTPGVVFVGTVVHRGKPVMRPGVKFPFIPLTFRIAADIRGAQGERESVLARTCSVRHGTVTEAVTSEACQTYPGDGLQLVLAQRAGDGKLLGGGSCDLSGHISLTNARVLLQFAPDAVVYDSRLKPLPQQLPLTGAGLPVLLTIALGALAAGTALTNAGRTTGGLN